MDLRFWPPGPPPASPPPDAPPEEDPLLLPPDSASFSNLRSMLLLLPELLLLLLVLMLFVRLGGAEADVRVMGEDSSNEKTMFAVVVNSSSDPVSRSPLAPHTDSSSGGSSRSRRMSLCWNCDCAVIV